MDKKEYFKYLQSKFCNLKKETIIRLLFLRETLKQAKNIHYTKETNVALFQTLSTLSTIAPIVRISENENNTRRVLEIATKLSGGSQESNLENYLFSLVNELPLIDLESKQLVNANKQEIYNFLIDNDIIEFSKEIFDELYQIAISCKDGKIKTTENLSFQLQRVLKISGGELRDYAGFIILLLAIFLKVCGIESFAPHGHIPELPHIEAAKDLFNRCLKPENRGSKACTPNLYTGLEAQSSDNVESTSNSKTIQASEFLNDKGSIDMMKAYSEVVRRADMLDYQNVYSLCPLNRFNKLVMEDSNKKPNIIGVREAITVLQAEMEGHFSESSRMDLGVKGKSKYQIQGPDYQAIDQNGNLIAVEVKNLAYKKSTNPSETPFENGKEMGATPYRQQHSWVQTNAEKLTKKYGNAIKIENLPKEPSDFVLVFDLFDVDQDAKKEVIAGIQEGAKNSEQIIIINADEICK